MGSGVRKGPFFDALPYAAPLWYALRMEHLKPVDPFKAVAAKGCYVYCYLRARWQADIAAIRRH